MREKGIAGGTGCPEAGLSSVAGGTMLSGDVPGVVSGNAAGRGAVSATGQ
ncbi:hypothetical protein ASZ90_000222 [hydrocarbon metagenome]|uniref:Uncharacterized protein n=1 Tax=hydrocarbon metagenome TaxID=938273 RepID=A0A0W8G9T1_9ZZZZ